MPKSPPYIHVYPHLYSYPRNSHVIPTQLTCNPHTQLTRNSHVNHTSPSCSNPRNGIGGYHATQCHCQMPNLAILSSNGVVGLAGCRTVTALVQLTNVYTSHATEHDNLFPMNMLFQTEQNPSTIQTGAWRSPRSRPVFRTLRCFRLTGARAFPPFQTNLLGVALFQTNFPDIQACAVTVITLRKRICIIKTHSFPVCHLPQMTSVRFYDCPSGS